MLNLPALAADMDALACATWDKVVKGEQWGVKFREDSLTDHNLFTLAAAHPRLLVQKHTGPRETQSGADWEWWVGSDATGWVVLRVQAKRVHGFTYDRLDHGGALPNEHQYDTLIRQCAQLPAHYPLHVFYSGWEDVAGTPVWPADAEWRACPAGQSPGGCGHALIQDYGCAVASSPDVRAVASSGLPKARYAPEHLSHCLPWSYLFRVPTARVGGPSLSRNRPQDLPAEWVSAHLSSQRDGWMDAFQAQLGSLAGSVVDPPSVPGPDDQSGGPPRVTELPPYVQQLQAARGLGPAPDRGSSGLSPEAETTAVLDIG